MNTTWEQRSAVRNHPRRKLTATGSHYFFPISEQPLCSHPKIVQLGEQAKAYILLQSAYLFMRTISLNETEVICEIVNRILREKAAIQFPERTLQNLRTVVMDEMYHAYVAHDFIQQLKEHTGVEPINWSAGSDLSRALNAVRESIAPEYVFPFEVVAACIAENSITKELIAIPRDQETDPFFFEVNSDHAMDEGSHCGIFLEVLTHLWKQLPEETKNALGAALPSFVRTFLGSTEKQRRDRAILSQLALTSDEIDTILRDTHPEFSPEYGRSNNPVIESIVTLLRKSGVLAHEATAKAFAQSELSDKTNASCKVHLDFLRRFSADESIARPSSHVFSIDPEVTRHQAMAFFLSYLHDVLQIDRLDFSVSTLYSGSSVGSLHMSTAHDGESMGTFIDRHHFLSEVLRINLNEDFQFEVLPSEAKLSKKVIFHFSEGYYDVARIQEFAENFSHYVQTALRTPLLRRCELPLVCNRLQEALLPTPANVTVTNQTVIDLFRQHTKSIPQHPAVENGSRTLTYEALEDLSNNVAWNLAKLSLPRGTVVAVMLEQRFHYVPVILGILKSGMVFFPVSQDVPRLRLEELLNEAQVGLVVTDKNVQQLSKFSLISAEEVFEPVAEPSPADPPRPEETAYIIFTSGSSSAPKGVAVTHRSLSNFVLSAKSTFPIRSEDRLLQFASFSFDASLADIFGVLASGATLCLRTAKMLDSSQRFFEECERMSISLMNLPASLWSQLIQDFFQTSRVLPPSLRTVVVGGEVIAASALSHWYRFVGHQVRLLNTYGPTETTIAVTACDLGKYPVLRMGGNLIGSPIANASICIRDLHQRLLPFGAEGELYIGGPGVSLGYYKQDSLTAETFLEFPGGRFYRSGDRGRWFDHDQGKALLYLGRVDRQVKLRGFRVDLNEIEKEINSHRNVSRNLVLLHEPSSTLIAYVEGSTGFCSEALQSYLEQRLPSHFRPGRIVAIEKWPLTPHGKIDTAALLQGKDGCEDDVPFTCTEESRLAAIWKDLLPQVKIHRKSHFFHAGGHSLLAMRLVARIQNEFEVNLTVRAILETPVLMELAQRISTSTRSLQRSYTTQAATMGPLSFFQQGLWWIDQTYEGASHQYNIAFALHLKGKLNTAALIRAVNAVAQKHEILRTVFLKDDEGLVQRVCELELRVTLERIDASALPDIALAESRMPFSLQDAPPIRTRLLELEPERHVLLVVQHHIAQDGESVGILTNDLGRLYNIFRAGELDPQYRPSHTYLQFAIAQAETDYQNHSLEYWQRKLEGYRPLRLTQKRSQRTFDPSRGATQYFLIDTDLTKAFRKLCLQRDCTTYVGLITLLNLLFRRSSEEDDVAFAAIVSTRDFRMHADTLGPFLNTVILRSHIRSTDTFESVLSNIQRTCNEAIEHASIPLSKISGTIPMARLSENYALFDIMVGYQGSEKSLNRFDAEGIQAELHFLENHTAKLGLSIDFYDSDDSIALRIEYAIDLYADSAICDLGEEFLSLMKTSVTTCPSKNA